MSVNLSSHPTTYAQSPVANRSLRVAMAINQSKNQQAKANSDHFDNRVVHTDQVHTGTERINNSDRSPRRLLTPGIHVSINTQSNEPEIDAYRDLRSNGRRKTTVSPQRNASQTKLYTSPDFNVDQGAENIVRKPGPQSRVVLDNFIQQMMGIDTPPMPGANINITV